MIELFLNLIVDHFDCFAFSLLFWALFFVVPLVASYGVRLDLLVVPVVVLVAVVVAGQKPEGLSLVEGEGGVVGKADDSQEQERRL